MRGKRRMIDRIALSRGLSRSENGGRNRRMPVRKQFLHGGEYVPGAPLDINRLEAKILQYEQESMVAGMEGDFGSAHAAQAVAMSLVQKINDYYNQSGSSKKPVSLETYWHKDNISARVKPLNFSNRATHSRTAEEKQAYAEEMAKQKALRESEKSARTEKKKLQPEKPPKPHLREILSIKSAHEQHLAVLKRVEDAIPAQMREVRKMFAHGRRMEGESLTKNIVSLIQKLPAPKRVRWFTGFADEYFSMGKEQAEKGNADAAGWFAKIGEKLTRDAQETSRPVVRTPTAVEAKAPAPEEIRVTPKILEQVVEEKKDELPPKIIPPAIPENISPQKIIEKTVEKVEELHAMRRELKTRARAPGPGVSGGLNQTTPKNRSAEKEGARRMSRSPAEHFSVMFDRLPRSVQGDVLEIMDLAVRLHKIGAREGRKGNSHAAAQANHVFYQALDAVRDIVLKP